MKKVIVIGCPGGGKSTFSRELQRITGLPLYHLDMLYWNADRTTVPKDIFRERLQNVMNQEAWIIDGNFQSTLEMRFQACDTVIFLDYPLEICLEGVAERKGKARADMPWIERDGDKEDLEFLEYIKNFQEVNRPVILELMERYSEKEILVFRGRDEAERFLMDQQSSIQNEIHRCSWCNMKNPVYVEYHDHEWCVPEHDDHMLFELLVLESFQAGLSWECVLNKRESFRKAFDGFDLEKVCQYGDEKKAELLENKNIIRNRLKINAAVNNAKIFKEIQKEYGTFDRYIWGFTDGKIIHEVGETRSELSDQISKDLKKRGMKFVGTTIIYSYLQAIGVLYSHDEGCFKYRLE